MVYKAGCGAFGLHGGGNHITMAILKLSGFLKGVSGKAGNVVYRYTKNGTELSDRPIVNNPKTPAQQNVRAAFTKATRGWRGLTRAQADAWNAYAAGITETEEISGNKTKRSGFNWYVAFSSRFYQVNNISSTAPSNPPTTSFTGDTLTFTAGPVANGIKITASSANSAAVTTALLFNKLSSANGKPSKGGYRTKAYFAFSSNSLATNVVLPPGIYSFGVQYASLATGQESNLQVINTIGPVTFAVSEPAAPSKKKAA